MKFALISNILPPSDTAHAAIIHRLLSELPSDGYCLVSSRNYEGADQPNYSRRLPGRYYHLAPTFQLTRGYRFGLKAARESINAVTGIIARARVIARILKQEQCEAVVVCTGGNEILDFPAGYLASRMVGARFYAYLLDQYSHMVSYVLGRSPLRAIEPLILKGSAAVIVPNEFLRDELKRRHQIEPVVIHNACDLTEYERTPESELRDDGGDAQIVYTGGIGTLHFDAFQNLMTAIELLKDERVKVHLYTTQQPAEIEQRGISGPLVYHDYEPAAAVAGIQQRADVLFLPLSFGMQFREIIKTAAPGKMGEYLASRRPILVHAPADSFIADYFRKHECGVVVDQADPQQLASALQMLLSDAQLRERLGHRAWERASEDFDVVKARDQFTELLERPSAP